jgi:ubiquinol-cytochrome c reductase cytochrome b subunit
MAKILKRSQVALVHDHIVDYPTPINLNNMWNFGALAGICLGIQILTGVFLAMHYTHHVDYAFLSVEHIMRDVNYGWLLRYMHANGASMFLLVTYIHIARGLYYGSYKSPRGFLWSIGVVIFLLMMGTAFIGYVLPWGQMSFWGATVITNLVSAIPVIGTSIVEWLWGGFSVDNATLNRFFSLHYLLPFAIAAAVLLHIAECHREGSNNPLGIHSKDVDKVTFYPYFYVKDFFFFWCFLGLFSYFVFLDPNVLGHADNYIEANPMVTPAHIVPEWYFLPFYAILRSIPDKLGGVLAMFGSIAILALLPILNTSNIRSSFFRPLHRQFFWLFIADVILLGWIGGCPVEDPYVLIGQLLAVYYFAYFLVILPGLGLLERVLLSHYLSSAK